MKISKVLSKNDLGSTGGHQSGVVIPVRVARSAFMPQLNDQLINPRLVLMLKDEANGVEYPVNFIYYNGKLHGTSTRNEYRLTGILPFLRDQSAQDGDFLVLERGADSGYRVSIIQSVPDHADVIKITIDSWSTEGI